MSVEKRRARFIRTGVITLLFALFLSYEASYRPKMQGAQGRVKIEIQPLKPLTLPKAEGDKQDEVNQGYSERNAQENRTAVEAFQQAGEEK